MARYQAALRPESVPRRGFPGAVGHCSGDERRWQFWGRDGLWTRFRGQHGLRLRLRPWHPRAAGPRSRLKGRPATRRGTRPARVAAGGGSATIGVPRRSSRPGALLSSVCGNQGGNVPKLYEVAPPACGVHPSALWAAGIVFLPTRSAGAISDDCRRIRCEKED